MDNTGNNKVNTKTRFNWYRARWSLLILFIGGYISTYSAFIAEEVEYFILTFFSVAACFLLLTRLKHPLKGKLPVWIILAVFLLAYYFKFYLINSGIYNTDDNIFLQQLLPYSLESFATLSYAFIAFCLTAWGLLSISKFGEKKILLNDIKYRPLFSFLKMTILWLILITASITYFFGILRMAAEGTDLPFRIGGWVYNIRVTLIPVLVVMLIWYSDEIRHRKHLILGISLLLLHGVSDILLRGSRGSLINMFIMLTFLFIITGRLSRQRVKLFLVVTICTILIFPLITAYRYKRADDPSASILNPLGAAVSSLTESSGTLSETLSAGGMSVLFRFVGMETLMPAVILSPGPLGMEVFNVKIHRYFTEDIMGVPPWAKTGIAPSLLGWFYLIGGNFMVSAGMFIFTISAWLIWRALSRARLLCRPVAKALFLFLLLGYASGGFPERIYLDILVNAGTIFLCEWIMRSFKKKTRLTLQYGQA